METVDDQGRGIAGVSGVRRIVVTGSECTGKTTLARAIAEHLDTVWTPEYAREFLRSKGAPLTADDVDPIARGQMALDDERLHQASHVLVLDTDLLSTIVYSDHYYGACPEWIEEEFRNRPADLYLLADIDVPWTPDGIFRDRGDRRVEMQMLFRDALASRGLSFVDVSGPHEERMRLAIEAVDGLIKSGKRKAESGNPPAHPFSTQRRKGAKPPPTRV
jgi:NadR type nicotinamide-nucleotide adenylyltransferase